MEYHTTHRTCRKCGSTYPLTPEFFVKDKKHSSGFMTQCKACRNAEKREWNANNPDKKREMGRRDRLKHPERIKEQQTRWANENADHVKEYRQNYYADHREEAIEKSLQYQRDNPEKVNTRNKRWAENNPERYREIRQKTYRKNKSKKLAWGREYNRKHPEKRRALGRQWYWNNRPKAIAKVQNRIAKKKQADGTHTAKELHELLEWQDYKCLYCGADIRNNWTEDHYYPLSSDIKDNCIHNIVLACISCNSRKKDKLPFLFDNRCL